ncbi:MAG: polysaccharide deacetylase family protein [Planctomyces sp.]|nr:polysaccharide deacetylase family protein [Planctomyces sp.]
MLPKREILARALDCSGVGRALRSWGSWRGLVVLNYHRIGDCRATPLDPGVFSATVDEFDRQLGWLKNHADVISLEDVDRALAEPQRRSVLITFDDGYRDNFELAAPLLASHGLRAAFFITTGFLDERPLAWWDEISWLVKHAARRRLPDRPDLFDRCALGWRPGEETDAIRSVLAAYKSLPAPAADRLIDELAAATETARPSPGLIDPWMTWDMVRELAAAGHAIAAHTVTHPLLGRCDLDRQAHEIRGSKARLEGQLGSPVLGFSYPVGIPGSYSDDTARLVREAGFRWAFSFQGGYADTRQPAPPDRYRLPRIAIETGLSEPQFRALHTLPQLFA